MTNELPLDVAAEMNACPDMATLAATFSAEIARYGFDASACGAFLPTDKGPESHFFFLNWPAAWMELYAARNFVAHDFGVAEARRRMHPFTWQEVKAERTLSDGEEKVWATALSWGWRDGFSVPIHGPGGYMAIVTMATRTPHFPPNVRMRLHLLALLVHERCRQIEGMVPPSPTSEPLTSRELECLRWVGAGKSDAEIGLIMGIAQTTVKFHVDNGRKKLGVRTRAQAFARLVLSGLS